MMIRSDPRAKVAVAHDALDLPDGTETGNIRDWCSYGIWGLLLYDQQPPWLTLIECIHILFHRYETNERKLFEPLRKDARGQLQHEVVPYQVPRNYKLRYLLFRDLDTSQIAARRSPDGEAQWRELTDRINDGASKSNLKVTFNDLRSAFEDVDSLNRALEVLQSTEVEASSKKRWTSRHLLPLGRDMLFADISEHDFNADRRFVRRAGELLYLMLGRAHDAEREKLEELLTLRLLSHETPWNELARLIRGRERDRGAPDEDPAPLKAGYLPIPRMAVYDRLAKDWVALLDLKAKPIEDLLDPLMRVSAIHQLIYILQRAQQIITEGESAAFSPFVFEIGGTSGRNPVRDIARRQYESHRLLPKHAIDAFIHAFGQSEHWTAGLGSAMETAHATKILEKMFLWKPREGDRITAKTDAATILKIYGESAREDSSHTIWASFTSRTKAAGFAQARTKAGTWYTPNDAVLEALVLANVTEPLELREFLRTLYDRYHIVIGQEQAQSAFGRDGSISLEQLKVNEQRLEHRLGTLGFVDRKSDACAFVVNPFYQQSDEWSAEAI